MDEARGILIVISGPSGVGKTTITRSLVDNLKAVFSISMTTREQTEADREGVDYFFVDRKQFEKAIERDKLLEYADVFGRYYGTPRQPVEESLATGRDVVLEIDVNGALQVKSRVPEAFLMFVLPPSMDELLNRLRSRGREDEERIQKRFAEAKREIEQAQSSDAYDVFITNDQLETATEAAIWAVNAFKANQTG